VVVSKDCTHDDYIVRGMKAGCDIVTEKPMTIDAPRCQRIVDTVRETGRNVRVTFNYRYSPFRTQVKELLQDGIIGRILSVEFKWLLDTSHGADYFRRWHRNKANSGGLMVHKATHHFDAVNWFINSVPARVTAIGARRFYTPEQAERYGFTQRAERCLGCPEKARCPFYLDLQGNALMKELYLDHESHDGYFRDRCVFSPEIDIEDSMNVCVEYRSGVTLSYALTAFSPWEGYHIVFNGTRGRLEHVCRETSYISGDGTTPGQLLSEGTTITVMPHFTRGYRVPIHQGEGGHGGGDRLLLDDLFAAALPPDPAGRRADYRGGAYSILTGVAANIAMKEQRVVVIDELVRGLELPDFTDDSQCDRPIKLPAFITEYDVSPLQPKKGKIARARQPSARLKYTRMAASGSFMNINPLIAEKDGIVYFKATRQAAKAGKAALFYGADGPSKIWLNGAVVAVYPDLTNPAGADQRKAEVALKKGLNELLVALDTNGGKAWGIFARFTE
jgi:predicted dehydrogenase